MKGKAHKEIAQLGRSLHKRRRDILAFFDRGVSNGPVEAINGRLEHLRGIALGFKKPQPLHLAMPHPLRRPHQQNQRTLKPEEPITVKLSDKPSIDYADFDRGQPAGLQETYAKEIAHVRKGLLAYCTVQDEAVKLCKQNQGGTVDFPSGAYEWIILCDSQAPELSDGAIAGIVLGVFAALGAFIAPQFGIVLPTLPHMYTS